MWAGADFLVLSFLVLSCLLLLPTPNIPPPTPTQTPTPKHQHPTQTLPTPNTDTHPPPNPTQHRHQPNPTQHPNPNTQTPLPLSTFHYPALILVRAETIGRTGAWALGFGPYKRGREGGGGGGEWWKERVEGRIQGYKEEWKDTRMGRRIEEEWVEEEEWKDIKEEDTHPAPAIQPTAYLPKPLISHNPHPPHPPSLTTLIPHLSQPIPGCSTSPFSGIRGICVGGRPVRDKFWGGILATQRLSVPEKERKLRRAVAKTSAEIKSSAEIKTSAEIKSSAEIKTSAEIKSWCHHVSRCSTHGPTTVLVKSSTGNIKLCIVPACIIMIGNRTPSSKTCRKKSHSHTIDR
ncbi:hypothetical protein F5877DRAFT_69414 [Lentinula edodes]|nr:hypothetical protein F5877DRAFT_69414 [Lentinula edodes]